MNKKEEQQSKSLFLKFDPRTIGDLGVKMYTRLPNALNEAISNSYDADASLVKIKIKQNNEEVEMIEIIDDGFGMSEGELEDFLIVGRKRLKIMGDKETPRGRKVTGRKGLGKLAMFGIANVVGVISIKNGIKNSFEMDYEEILNTDELKDNYEVKRIDINKQTDELDGTNLYLKNIKRETKIDQNDLAINLSRRFHFDDKFKCQIIINDSDIINVNFNKQFEGLDIQFEFNISENDFKDKCIEFSEDNRKITGFIKTLREPIRPHRLQGISIFSRNKLVNEPTAFGSTSNNFFRYIYGRVDIDFITDEEEDLISTNRRTLDWDNPKLKNLEDCLKKMLGKKEQEWRMERKKDADKNFKEKYSISIEEVIETIPEDKKEAYQKFIEIIIEDPDKDNGKFIALCGLVPPYSAFHWRSLHKSLRDEPEIFEYYKREKYFDAIKLAMSVYFVKLEKFSGTKEKEGLKLISEKLTDKNPFDERELDVLLDNLRKGDAQSYKEGRFLIAKGTSFFTNISRHNISQAAKDMFKIEELLTEQNCLDILSAISLSIDLLEKSNIKN